MTVFINGRFLTQKVTGVQRYGRELVAALDKLVPELGHPEINLFCPAGTEIPPYQHIRTSTAGRLSGHLWEQLELPHHVRNGCLFCPGNTAPFISLLTQPCVVTVHSLAFRYFPNAYSRAFRSAYAILIPAIMARAAQVITVSESEASLIRAAYPGVATRLTAIQNGGMPTKDLSLIPSVGEKKLDFPYGLYVGSLSGAKNFPALLSAVISFVENSQFGFVFVGGSGGTIRSNRADIPDHLAERILFAGQVDNNAELLAWYKGAHFFAFPSLYEASPLPPIEAMSAGSPVLASDIPALVERCGDAAIYCDPRNAGQIAGQMLKIAMDQTLRAELIARGRKRAAEFSWEACARATWRVMQGVSAG